MRQLHMVATYGLRPTDLFGRGSLFTFGVYPGLNHVSCVRRELCYMALILILALFFGGPWVRRLLYEHQSYQSTPDSVFHIT